ncbi:hypothetical protein L0F63_000387 [Massospora cicadina]|nr:hypothetical protein L0F63_000387 [Massospora cicadina]
MAYRHLKIVDLTPTPNLGLYRPPYRGLFTGLRPGPIPLEDKRQQREMEELIRSAKDELDASPMTLAAAERRDNQNINPMATSEDPLPGFVDGINPDTHEVGGPKGKEPTRYGDWERKGRAYDF